jgi:hypothetical protein
MKDYCYYFDCFFFNFYKPIAITYDQDSFINNYNFPTYLSFRITINYLNKILLYCTFSLNDFTAALANKSNSFATKNLPK